jgi:SAM-dependent methyltransferase
VERFHAVAGDYARFRPRYPDAVVDRVLAVAGLPRPGALVVDLGCGTGISSRAFAARGLRVVGVDPNATMLAEARAAGGGPEYRSGESVATGLDAGCADLVAAAQAFHWFDVGPTLAELRRVLRPGGWLAAFWNLRRTGTPFNDAYEAALRRFIPDDERIRDMASLEALRARAGAAEVVDLHHEHADLLDRESFLGRVRSASYVAHGVRDREGLEKELHRIFDAHSREGRVEWALVVEGVCLRLGGEGPRRIFD